MAYLVMPVRRIPRYTLLLRVCIWTFRNNINLIESKELQLHSNPFSDLQKCQLIQTADATRRAAITINEAVKEKQKQ